MGAATILGIYLGVGLAFAIFASIFSGHSNVRFAVFIWVVLGWLFIVPRAMHKALKEVKEKE